MFNQKLRTNLDGHVEDVKREIENKIEEKRRQTSKMPTILLLDFIRVADAWMISHETWTNEMHDLIEPEIPVRTGYRRARVTSALRSCFRPSIHGCRPGLSSL